MPFSIYTNLGSLQAYNALANVNAATQKAQLQLATQKKINSVADDTSGYSTGKKLQAQTMKMQSELNNVASGKNYLATAEAALQQVNDKLNQISSKYIDSQDPLKDKSSIAKDINTLAGEIDSILKNTNINGHNLLASTNGSTLANSDTFDVGGNTFSTDFASNSYLNADAIKTALNGSTTSDPGVTSYIGNTFDANGAYTQANQSSTIKASFADGTSQTWSVNLNSCTSIVDVWNAWYTTAPNSLALSGSGVVVGPKLMETPTVYDYSGKNITGLETIAGFDMTTLIGITRIPSGGVSSGGLLSTDTTTALSAASNISAISDDVRSALGRIGNLSQTLDSRSDFLTSAVTNNTATISNIFDTDVVQQQINSSKDQIASQIATSMLSQMNSASQNLLTLFR